MRMLVLQLSQLRRSASDAIACRRAMSTWTLPRWRTEVFAAIGLVRRCRLLCGNCGCYCLRFHRRRRCRHHRYYGCGRYSRSAVAALVHAFAKILHDKLDYNFNSELRRRPIFLGNEKKEYSLSTTSMSRTKQKSKWMHLFGGRSQWSPVWCRNIYEEETQMLKCATGHLAKHFKSIAFLSA